MDNINENENGENRESSEQSSNPISLSRVREYGKKAYGPLINVVYKYQDEFTPYLNALGKGLQGGADALNRDESSEAEKYVSQFFRQAADGFNEACRKLESRDVKAFTEYVSEMATNRPSIMFSTSYVAGLFFGRLGRHIASKQRRKGENNFENDQSIMTDEPPSFDESIH